jgi:hypothetical protein
VGQHYLYAYVIFICIGLLVPYKKEKSDISKQATERVLYVTSLAAGWLALRVTRIQQPDHDGREIKIIKFKQKRYYNNINLIK